MAKGRHAGWMAVAALALSTLLMWLPARHTPFWGDDYVFLLKAHAANLSTAPWWSDFWPQTPVRFWRPLSQEGYWRLMDVLFGVFLSVPGHCQHGPLALAPVEDAGAQGRT